MLQAAVAHSPAPARFGSPIAARAYSNPKYRSDIFAQGTFHNFRPEIEQAWPHREAHATADTGTNRHVPTDVRLFGRALALAKAKAKAKATVSPWVVPLVVSRRLPAWTLGLACVRACVRA